MRNMQIPEKVNQIIHTLIQAGYEAYAVGGCVRDALLERVPDDWDITTSAQPMEVKALFPHTIDTGIQHGTVTVMLKGEGFEVTTYRIDGEYEDSRHPKEVRFTSNLTEDLKRRDFTINAMAYNEEAGLVDVFGGVEDIQRKMIRCVGDPHERFTEDALRILRAVRFSAQLGFAIHPDTQESIAQMAPSLSRISAERIAVELLKLLVSPHPDTMRLAWELGITKVILPEFDDMMATPQNTPHHCYSVGEHTIKSLTEIPADKVLRLTMLLHDMGKPRTRITDENGRDRFPCHSVTSEELVKKILRRLKLDNDTISKVTRLVKWHDYRCKPTYQAVRRAVNKIGEDLFPMLLLVQKADAMAQSTYRREEKLERIQNVEEIYADIQKEGQCVSLKTLAVTGSDLIAQGMKPGPEIGETLNYLLDAVLEDPSCNTKEYLLHLLRAENK
ncbi:MAG: CCA tRNA nucleotidyltransferase [Lachnospiraceae bacterium]